MGLGVRPNSGEFYFSFGGIRQVYSCESVAYGRYTESRLKPGRSYSNRDAKEEKHLCCSRLISIFAKVTDKRPISTIHISQDSINLKFEHGNEQILVKQSLSPFIKSLDEQWLRLWQRRRGCSSRTYFFPVNSNHNQRHVYHFQRLSIDNLLPPPPRPPPNTLPSSLPSPPQKDGLPFDGEAVVIIEPSPQRNLCAIQ